MNSPLLSRCLLYLRETGIEHSLSIHVNAKGAHGFASPEGIPLRDLAFTVVYYGDNRYGMLILPADRIVDFWAALDFGKVRALMGLRQIRLASEPELASLFPDCDVSAVPPFGSLFEMPVLFEHDLAATEFMRFNIGLSRDVIRIQTADFLRLVSPRVGSFATKRPVVKGYSPLPERYCITEQAIRC